MEQNHRSALPGNSWFSLERIALILLVAAALVQIAAIIILPFEGHDAHNHLFWIAEWHKFFEAGILYPRWMPDAFGGFGAPSFYFYPPLTYIFTSALGLLVPAASPSTIAKTWSIVALIGSGASMWIYLRWKFPSNRLGPAMGALLYIAAPYRFFNVIPRGSLPEHTAFLFIPFVFWAVDLLASPNTQKRQKGILLLAISDAALLLTNLPAATVTVLGSAVYAIFLPQTRRFSVLLCYAIGSIAALFLVAIYLVPMISDFTLVHLHLLWIRTPVLDYTPYLALFTGRNLTANSYSLLMLMGALMLGFQLHRDRTSKKKYSELFAFFIIVVLILTVQLPFLSYWLFLDVPPFNIVQIPFRTALLLIPIAVVLWTKEINDGRPKGGIVPIVVVWSAGAIILTTMQLFSVRIHPHRISPPDDAPEYTTQWERPDSAIASVLSTSFAFDSQSAIIPGSDMINPIRRALFCDTVNYRSASPSVALFRRAYWPDWNAAIDGNRTETTPDSFGRLTVPIPAGTHRLVVWLGEARSSQIGMWMSVTSFLFLLGFWFFLPRSQKTFRKSSSSA